MMLRKWLPFRTTASVQFGDTTLRRTHEGTWRCQVTHRGHAVTLTAETLPGLREVLLDIKQVRLPVEDLVESMDDWSKSRLYECWTTNKVTPPWQLPSDDWLLLNDLVHYGVRAESWHSIWPKSHPERYPVRLTGRGSEACRILFDKSDLSNQERREVHKARRRDLLEHIYRSPEPRPTSYVVLHWTGKVKHISTDHIESLLVWQDTDPEEEGACRWVRSLPEYIVPPQGVYASRYWIKYCTRLWKGPSLDQIY